MLDIKLHTLGCGSAKPSLQHNPSSTVLELRNSLMMIDCGEGTQMQFQKYKLKFSKLSDIFITHLHGDHVLGIPGLISSLGLASRDKDLTIHTFKEGKDMLSSMLSFFCPHLPFHVNFNVIGEEKAIIFENGELTVETIPLRHRIPDVGFIFREKEGLRHIIPEKIQQYNIPVNQIKGIKEGADFIDSDGKIIQNVLLTTPPSPTVSYAHMSDTLYMPDLAEKIGPVNLLFHETTYLDEHASDAMNRFHSTARQAATVARDTGAKALLTGHYSTRYRDDSLFLKEAEEVFPNVILNYEGLELPIV